MSALEMADAEYALSIDVDHSGTRGAYRVLLLSSPSAGPWQAATSMPTITGHTRVLRAVRTGWRDNTKSSVLGCHGEKERLQVSRVARARVARCEMRKACLPWAGRHRASSSQTQHRERGFLLSRQYRFCRLFD